jgi:hypothetical protein
MSLLMRSSGFSWLAKLWIRLMETILHEVEKCLQSGESVIQMGEGLLFSDNASVSCNFIAFSARET